MHQTCGKKMRGAKLVELLGLQMIGIVEVLVETELNGEELIHEMIEHIQIGVGIGSV